MSILDELAAHARQRVQADAAQIPLDVLRERAARDGAADGAAFTAALRKPGLSFLCEVKRASPSKGMIAEEFPYVEIAREYEAAGADAVSCLTEPKWFLGSDRIFREIRREISLPMLRKDFTVDEYQIYQAKDMGANAVLLICALLDTGTLARFILTLNDVHIRWLFGKDGFNEWERIHGHLEADEDELENENMKVKSTEQKEVEFFKNRELNYRKLFCIYLAKQRQMAPHLIQYYRSLGVSLEIGG